MIDLIMSKISILLLTSFKSGISIKLTALKPCLIGRLWKSGSKAKHENHLNRLLKLKF